MFGKIGGVGLIVGHPFDTVKVVQQTQGLSAGQSIKLICQQSGYRGNTLLLNKIVQLC